MESSNRKPESLDGGLENSPRRRLERNPGIELCRSQVRVAKTFAARAPGRRAPSDAGDAFSNCRRRLFRAPLQIRPRNGRNRDVKVDPVEQRSGELSSVTRPGGWIAAARAARIAGEAARARVHCRDEEKIARIGERAADAHDRDPLLLDRLADPFEDVAPELRELV